MLLVLDYIKMRANFCVQICILNKTFNIWFESKRRYIYMFIVHIKMTLHKFLYTAKMFYPLHYGPAQNLNNLFHTEKITRCQQLQIIMRWCKMGSMNWPFWSVMTYLHIECSLRTCDRFSISNLLEIFLTFKPVIFISHKFSLSHRMIFFALS